MLDSTDIQILNILQDNGKITNAELARQIGMAPSGVLERVKKLENKGVIDGYEVRLNPKALGISLSTFIQIKTSDFRGQLRHRTRARQDGRGSGSSLDRRRIQLSGQGQGQQHRNAGPVDEAVR